MSASPRFSWRRHVALAVGLAGAVAASAALHAQSAAVAAATGSIEGRVFNAATGQFAERVRLTVDGTGLETFTDADGYYRLPAVPAGPARVTAFFTGSVPVSATVQITAGRAATQDLTLGAAPTGPVAPGAADSVVKLSAFVVGSPSMDGAALAINEQRFAGEIKTVVSAQEFGQVAEANVAEFLKFMPGLAIEYGGGNARSVSLGGSPAGNVPVTVGGFDLSSAGTGGTGRAAALDFVSINNISRVEVLHSPTPESPGAALAGSVNMVPRSAFERPRAELSGSVFLMMRDNDRDFSKSPGPTHEPRRKVHPGFDFAYSMPVNRRFGFTLSANHSKQFSPQDFVLLGWRGASLATNGAALPNTAPDRPYLTDFSVRDDLKETGRTSFGASVDYRLTDRDRLSFAFQATQNYVDFFARTLTFAITRVAPGDFSLTHTRGATGTGAGNLTVLNNAINRTNRTVMPTFTWRHHGPVWRGEAGLGFSRSINRDRDVDFGFFNNMTAVRNNVSIAYDDIFYLRPGRITVTDGATGAPVDPYRLATKTVTNATSNPRDSSDTRKTAYLNAGRDFAGRIPLSLKAGVDVRVAERDTRGMSTTFTHTGTESAAEFIDAEFSRRIAPFGFPQIDWVSNTRLYSHYVATPSHFTVDANGQYRSTVNNSKFAQETISSAFLRADAAFLDRRLRVVTGLRAEQTNVEAQGPRSDPTLNFQRDASGRPVLGANGRPANIATDALAISRLTFLDRGLAAEKEYLRLFPSLNLAYNLRENLTARGAYYWSVGRPDFNQYAGGVTLPDTTVAPGPGNRITVNNAGVKAWTARTTKLRLEYYFERVGQISVGAFRRDFENFWTTRSAAGTPELLATYDLDPATYGGYEVSTQYNVPGILTMTGLEFDYRQALTFLPSWARGVQVFANATALRATGEGADNFAGFVPRAYNWGASLTRDKFNVRVHWNYRGRQRRGLVTGAGIAPSTYNWGNKRLYLDVLGEYNFSRRFALFANLRNINDATEDFEVAGPATPASAQFRQRTDFGALWTFGLKGRF
jgi:iron complex outermembrane receptor protein